MYFSASYWGTPFSALCPPSPPISGVGKGFRGGEIPPTPSTSTASPPTQKTAISPPQNAYPRQKIRGFLSKFARIYPKNRTFRSHPSKARKNTLYYHLKGLSRDFCETPPHQKFDPPHIPTKNVKFCSIFRKIRVFFCSRVFRPPHPHQKPILGISTDSTAKSYPLPHTLWGEVTKALL